MAKAQKVVLTPEEKAHAKLKRRAQIKRDRWMYLLLLPGFLYFIIFKIVPMYGVLIAFKDYYASSQFFGAGGSEFLKDWIGFENFRLFLTDQSFWMLLKNTLIISLMNIVFFFPLPIIMALLLNEMKVQWYKKTIQTLVYVPHFVSMVVVFSITYVLLKAPASATQSGGAIYEIIKAMRGGNGMNVLEDKIAIYWVILLQSVWKETGWGTIIFLAALAGVDVEQYEAAIVDGANRFQQLVYITIPAIMGTVVTMFILRMGSVLNTGYEQLILLKNDANANSIQTFDTYVYYQGMQGGEYGYTTAVSLFKSIISIIFIQSANTIAKHAGQEGLY